MVDDMRKFKVFLVPTALAALFAMLCMTSLGAEPESDADTAYDVIHPKRMERVREQLGVTNADEWKIIEQRVGKVLEAQHDLGPKAPSKKHLAKRDYQAASGKGKGKRPAGAVDSDSLQESLDSNAPTAEMKALLEKYHAARREKIARLETARDQLRKVLSVRQEVQATLLGILD